MCFHAHKLGGSWLFLRIYVGSVNFISLDKVKRWNCICPHLFMLGGEIIFFFTICSIFLQRNIYLRRICLNLMVVWWKMYLSEYRNDIKRFAIAFVYCEIWEAKETFTEYFSNKFLYGSFCSSNDGINFLKVVRRKAFLPFNVSKL